MKDFISKVTFGFLMAQLLPGALVVASITCSLGLGHGRSIACLPQVLSCIENQWFKSAFSTVAFLFVAVAVGMLIHGLNWAILAWLENWGHPDDPRPVRERPWHRWPIWRQLLVGSVVMAREVWTLISKAPDIEHLTMDENVNGRATQWSTRAF